MNDNTYYIGYTKSIIYLLFTYYIGTLVHYILLNSSYRQYSILFLAHNNYYLESNIVLKI